MTARVRAALAGSAAAFLAALVLTGCGERFEPTAPTAPGAPAPVEGAGTDHATLSEQRFTLSDGTQVLCVIYTDGTAYGLAGGLSCDFDRATMEPRQ